MTILCSASSASGKTERVKRFESDDKVADFFNDREAAAEAFRHKTIAYLPAPPSCTNSSGATKQEFILAKRIGFALNTILQTCAGAIGLVGNIVATGILTSSKRLSSTFNQVLVCNLMLQTLYIISCILIEVYKLTEAPEMHHFFSFFLYPCKPMLLYASTMLTVLMARERSLAVRSPITYRSRTMTEGRWRRAMAYTTVSVVLASLFVLPLVWESKVVLQDVPQTMEINSTHSWVSIKAISTNIHTADNDESKLCHSRPHNSLRSHPHKLTMKDSLSRR